MKKKTFAGIVATLCLLGTVLAGCGGAAPGNGSSTSGQGGVNPSGKQLTVGFAALNNAINPYTTIYQKILQQEAAKLNVKLVEMDPKSDPVKQVQQMQTLIQQKVDAIILWPINAQAIIPEIKKAQAAGIPVIITNSPIDEAGRQHMTAYTGPDNKAEGKAAGEMMAKALGGKGTIVEITGLPGYQTTLDRMAGFREAIANYPDMKIIDSQPGDFDRSKAQKVMENFLTKHAKFDGLYAAEDNMAAGAISALKDAGRLSQVKITSATFYGVGYDAIKKGELYGSVWQSPELDARLAIETAAKAAKGETVPKDNYFDTPKVTAENVDQIGRPEF